MRLKPRSLALIAGVKVIVSFGFLYIGIRDNPVPAMLYLLLLGAGAAYYFLPPALSGEAGGFFSGRASSRGSVPCPRRA